MCNNAELEELREYLQLKRFQHKQFSIPNPADQLDTIDARFDAIGPGAEATINDIIAQVAALFKTKGKTYASDSDPLANVHGALPVLLGAISGFEYAVTMCSKHDIAVWLELNRAKAAGREPVVQEEWLLDSITWRVIALALLRGY